jgi:limonene-1,2-epoxide hydrolase
MTFIENINKLVDKLSQNWLVHDVRLDSVNDKAAYITLATATGMFQVEQHQVVVWTINNEVKWGIVQ